MCVTLAPIFPEEALTYMSSSSNGIIHWASEKCSTYVKRSNIVISVNKFTGNILCTLKCMNYMFWIFMLYALNYFDEKVHC